MSWGRINGVTLVGMSGLECESRVIMTYTLRNGLVCESKSNQRQSESIWRICLACSRAGIDCYMELRF